MMATLMPKEGEQTVLWQSDPKRKPVLPDGAVEIGTIAETEPEDEELDVEPEQGQLEGKETEQTTDDKVQGKRVDAPLLLTISYFASGDRISWLASD